MDNKDFSEIIDCEVFDFTEETKEDKSVKKDIRLREKYLNSHFEKLENLQTFKMPKENEIDFLITEMNFNAFTFIPFIMKTEVIENISFSTYNLAKRVILSIGKFLKNNQINKVSVIVSEFMKYDHQNIIDIMEDYKNKLNFDFQIKGNHSKINCIKTDKNYYIISGSGNFSDNAHPEQYVIINNKNIYNKIVNEFFN